GVYRGQCAELCGKDHGFMPIVVEALPKAEFQRWLASRRSAAGTAPAAAPAGPTAAPPSAAPATPAGDTAPAAAPAPAATPTAAL
ncbi:cytochrome c oxidase subunit II, partial [Xanthomonas vasicola]